MGLSKLDKCKSAFDNYLGSTTVWNYHNVDLDDVIKNPKSNLQKIVAKYKFKPMIICEGAIGRSSNASTELHCFAATAKNLDKTEFAPVLVHIYQGK